MNRFIVAAIAGVILMSGCAASAPPGQGERTASREDAPLGSLFKRKPGTVPDNGGQVDMQSLENARNNGNGVINLPTR